LRQVHLDSGDFDLLAVAHLEIRLSNGNLRSCGSVTRDVPFSSRDATALPHTEIGRVTKAIESDFVFTVARPKRKLVHRLEKHASCANVAPIPRRVRETPQERNPIQNGRDIRPWIDPRSILALASLTQLMHRSRRRL